MSEILKFSTEKKREILYIDDVEYEYNLDGSYAQILLFQRKVDELRTLEKKENRTKDEDGLMTSILTDVVEYSVNVPKKILHKLPDVSKLAIMNKWSELTRGTFSPLSEESS